MMKFAYYEVLSTTKVTSEALTTPPFALYIHVKFQFLIGLHVSPINTNRMLFQ